MFFIHHGDKQILDEKQNWDVGLSGKLKFPDFFFYKSIWQMEKYWAQGNLEAALLIGPNYFKVLGDRLYVHEKEMYVDKEFKQCVVIRRRL